jgi:hypothetical protein
MLERHHRVVGQIDQRLVGPAVLLVPQHGERLPPDRFAGRVARTTCLDGSLGSIEANRHAVGDTVVAAQRGRRLAEFVRAERVERVKCH